MSAPGKQVGLPLRSGVSGGEQRNGRNGNDGDEFRNSHGFLGTCVGNDEKTRTARKARGGSATTGVAGSGACRDREQLHHTLSLSGEAAQVNPWMALAGFVGVVRRQELSA